ncbi:AI-2E family transporter [Pseudonocardia bannensis]|uniref:AI-2E family transporter n=1 Tax=Pseudonocardia bannensis TaxID=630973 RepID=A0A848DI95_9PSEU|nr:AI-2E family transporter [Pseudonocardia bannensis]NMH92275.1 AI-2E family transporter [Pseudonocardia bannensis]
MTTPGPATVGDTVPVVPLSPLPRGLVILLGAAAAVVVVGGMKATAWLIGPVFLALVIVIAVSPLQAWARRHGWPGWLSTLTLVVAVYAVILALVLVVVISVAQLATLLPTYADQAEALLRGVTAQLQKLGVDPAHARATAGSADLNRLAGIVGSLLSSVSGVLTSVVFLLALLLFLSVETSGMPARLAAIARDRAPVAAALVDFARGTRSYFVVSTVFGLIVAVLDTVALALLGVPLPVLWGLLAFITNYIPNVGFVIGVIPPALLALLSGGWQLMVWVIVVYCVLNFVVQSLIQPRFVGDSVGLSTTMTFVALVFWAWVLGGLGALLAIPMTLLVKAVLVDTDPQAAWVDALVRAPRRAQATEPPTPAGDEEPAPVAPAAPPLAGAEATER